MKLTWNGHSCFTLETKEGSAVLDPYADGKVPGLAPLRLTADLVLCSHEHRDHNAREVVTLTGKTPTFGIETISTFHDAERGALRGENVIHIISAEGMRAAHLGDLGADGGRADDPRGRILHHRRRPGPRHRRQSVSQNCNSDALPLRRQRV